MRIPTILASLLFVPACAATQASNAEDTPAATARLEPTDRTFLKEDPVAARSCHGDGDCPTGALCHPSANRCFSSHPLPRMLDVGYTRGNDSRAARSCVLVPVYFAYDDVTLVDEAGRWLEHDKHCLDAQKPHRIILTGHADARGDPQYNAELSRRRGEVVKSFLKDQGVDVPVDVVGMGAEEPLRNGKTEHDYAYNRRVEILVK